MSVRNGGIFIQESINSILEQTYKDFEFIIIDDASDDGTKEVLSSVKSLDSRIRIISNEKNLGLPASLNRGLDIATGEYIARHDADDVAMPWRLEVQYDFLERHLKYFLCGGSAYRIDENGRSIGHFEGPVGEARIVKALTQEMRNPVIHPSIMYRNVTGIRYRSRFVYAQDYDFHLLLLTKGLRIFNLPQVLLKYRVNNTHVAALKGYSQLLYRRAAFRFYQERLEKGKDSYESFDFDSCAINDLAAVSEPGDLPIIARLQFAANAAGRDVRKAVYRSWTSKAAGMELLPLLALSFLSLSSREQLRKWKRKLVTYFNRNRRFPGIALLASIGGGASTWKKVGTLRRELAIYEALARRGWKVYFYTYDAHHDVADVASDVKIVPALPCRIPSRFAHLYGYFLPFLHYFSGIKNSVIVTNQAHSGWPAILMKKAWDARVIARCGYVLGEQAETMKFRDRRTLRRVRLEARTHANADLSFVPTPDLMEWCRKKMCGFNALRARVVPNFVDTDLFIPNPDVKKDIDVICVGRLAKEKRCDLIVESLSKLSGLHIVFIGSGPEEKFLISKARSCSSTVDFIARVNNDEIPAYLNRSKVYLIASMREGHPKSLLEAMACGCACVGTNSPGIVNQITHGMSGILCDSKPAEIADAVNHLLTHEIVRDQLGRKAREWICNNYSFPTIFKLYEDSLVSLMAE